MSLSKIQKLIPLIQAEQSPESLRLLRPSSMPGLVRGSSLKELLTLPKGKSGLLQTSVQESFFKDELVEPSIFKRSEERLLGVEIEGGEGKLTLRFLEI